jgi:signal peptidase I
MNIFTRRRTKKNAKGMLRHARHVRNMRRDLIQADILRTIEDREGELRALLKRRAASAEIERATEQLYEVLSSVTPKRRFPGIRENIEVIAVAIAVAMAFRTYFFQPFKIPTGSMQTTLYGIHSEQRDAPAWSDQVPVKYLKWIATGRWYRKIEVTVPGVMSRLTKSPLRPDIYYCKIGGNTYKLPKDAVLRGELSHYRDDYVPSGTVLWEGVVTTGDHVFVDKVQWNFTSPQRGDVVVFTTEGIEGLMQDTHYIKRLVGLPGEQVTLVPPNILIDGKVPTNTPILQEIRYRLPDRHARMKADLFLEEYGQSAAIPSNSYFVLGDNSDNSKDGRYWGTVPERNTVGPAVLVYWPFTERWGLIP